MSFSDGWSALNLEMPARVPRTEYSVAEYHWPLIERVTGLKVDAHSSPEAKHRARQALRRAWNFDFNWNVLVDASFFGEVRTKMGHAEYASEGDDFNSELRCPFDDPEQVLRFDPWEAYGPVDRAQARRLFEENYQRNRQSFPEEVNMTGVYVTLMSGLIDIFGWDMLLLACGIDARRFGEMALRYAGWMQQYMEALADADLPCVMIHDDIVWTSGAFLHPEWYRTYLFPSYKKYFAPILESGKKLIYTSDGCYNEFIDDLAATGVNGFVMEPSVDMARIAQRYGATHAFIGNADTRILLSGSREDIYREVERCMAIGKDCPGFLLAVGNHIPANTPVESCLIYEEAYEKLSRR